MHFRACLDGKLFAFILISIKSFKHNEKKAYPIF